MQKYSYYYLSVLAIFLLAACSEKPQHVKEERFSVSDTLLSKLEIDTVGASSSSVELTFTGKVVPVEDNMVRIYPMVSGIVHDVHVHSGDFIKKGQVLATLGSPEMAGYARESVSADAQLAVARRNVDVASDLYKSGLASEKDLQQAKSEYEIARAEHARTKAIMELNPGKGGLNYVIKSPISGFLVEKRVTDNMQVRADNPENLFTVADLSKMWVMINIYESDISQVKAGDRVKINTLSYPDKVFGGQIEKIYNMLDPDDKVMRARVRVDNPDLILKPEMFANVKVQARSNNAFPVINTRCLIFDNNKNYVVVTDGRSQAAIREVEIARKVEDKAYIRNGLKSGEKLVASRQVFLYEGLKN